MDDDADQLARDLLLARRLKLGVRLVVYPMLLGALVLAFHHRNAQAADDDAAPSLAVAPATWTGRFGTQDVAAWTVRRTVTGIRATFPLRCRDGGTFTLRFDDLHLEHDAHASWSTTVSEHSRADDGGAMTVDDEVRAWEDGAGVTVGWRASVLWTRHDTGRVVRCDGGPAHTVLRLVEPGAGA